MRKILKLLREAQEQLAALAPGQASALDGADWDWDLWIPFFREGWKEAGDREPFPDHRNPGLWLRLLDSWRQLILDKLGISRAEWDFSLSPRDGTARDLVQFPVELYLEDLRSPFNVGSIFRSAEAFGAQGIVLSPMTPGPEHLRVQRTAMGTNEVLPWRRCLLEDIAPEVNVFALEMGGTPLGEFEFPPRGICLLGTEELGLSPQALKKSDQSWGRVSIPLYGKKSSLNVAVAAGILLESWTRSLMELKGTEI